MVIYTTFNNVKRITSLNEKKNNKLWAYVKYIFLENLLIMNLELDYMDYLRLDVRFEIIIELCKNNRI